ncbi:MAG: transcriptional repressor LexA [Proteobacteria bacterium]|nr:transcriptional repressor LexA [Pseudomonadota bacterium]
MLTRKQYELLQFIDRRLRATGVSPSFDEMKDALGLRSKSGIHRLITGLEERGFIRRLPHRARALEVMKLPENMQAPSRPAPVPSNVVKGPFDARARRAVPENPAPREAVEIPLFGRIAAGTPIEALSDPSRTIEVPAAMLGSGEFYALEVSGDSMAGAGIYDGDTVILHRQDTADNGAIVVALVDNEEVTLKRLHRKGGSIALEPANPAYETRIFGPDRIKVQGQLVGLIRRY